MLRKNLDNLTGILIIAAVLCAWSLSPVTCGVGPRAVSANDFREVGGDVCGGEVTDHGALTGLADDDHPQYYRRGEQATFSNISGVDMQLGGSLSLNSVLPVVTLNTTGFSPNNIMLDFSGNGTMRNRIKSRLDGSALSWTFEDSTKTYITLGGIDADIALGADVEMGYNSITGVDEISCNRITGVFGNATTYRVGAYRNFTTLQQAFDTLPAIIDKDVDIYMDAGVYTGPAVLRGKFYTGDYRITIHGDTTRVKEGLALDGATADFFQTYTGIEAGPSVSRLYDSDGGFGNYTTYYYLTIDDGDYGPGGSAGLPDSARSITLSNSSTITIDTNWSTALSAVAKPAPGDHYSVYRLNTIIDGGDSVATGLSISGVDNVCIEDLFFRRHQERSVYCTGMRGGTWRNIFVDDVDADATSRGIWFENGNTAALFNVRLTDIRKQALITGGSRISMHGLTCRNDGIPLFQQGVLVNAGGNTDLELALVDGLQSGCNIGANGVAQWYWRGIKFKDCLSRGMSIDTGGVMSILNNAVIDNCGTGMLVESNGTTRISDTVTFANNGQYAIYARSGGKVLGTGAAYKANAVNWFEDTASGGYVEDAP